MKQGTHQGMSYVVLSSWFLPSLAGPPRRPTVRSILRLHLLTGKNTIINISESVMSSGVGKWSVSSTGPNTEGLLSQTTAVNRDEYK